MTVVFLDLETRSTVDLGLCGADEYAAHLDTRVLCMAYSIDGEEPRLWVDGDSFPVDLADALLSGAEVHAHNAAFERAMWTHHLYPRRGWPPIRASQWRCTAAKAAVNGVPRSLAKAAASLKLDMQKDDVGRRVMLQLCKPKPKRKNSPPGVVEWYDDEHRHNILREYCRQDVRTEQAVDRHCAEMPSREVEVWRLDAEINARGIPVDRESIHAAIQLTEVIRSRNDAKLVRLTGGEVRSSQQVTAMRHWLFRQGCELPDLQAATVAGALARRDLSPEAREVLTIRAAGSKSSVAKYLALEGRSRVDGRVRGAHVYYGAHTGRWSGSGVQFQNLPRGILKKHQIEGAIDLVRVADCELIEMLYGDPAEVLSSLIRPMVRAPFGKKLIVCDFAGIEARVLAWLSGHDRLVGMFANGEDLYVDMARKIYNIPETEEVTKAQRTIGKCATLGCGYQMGGAKFYAVCQAFGLSDVDEDFAAKIVKVYRSANEPIVNFWSAANDGFARLAAAGEKPARLRVGRGVECGRRDGLAYIKLPSGRKIYYRNLRTEQKVTPWSDGKSVPVLVFDSPSGERDLYGGKLVENIVQAVARDFLAEAMLRLDAAGFKIIAHVHDETVIEAEMHQQLKEVEQIMRELPDWATGAVSCPIDVEGFEAERYRK